MEYYISHTAYCTGWNIDSMYEGTIFKKSARTSRFKREGVRMLDWDYRKFKTNQDKIIRKHIEIINSNHDLEIVMLPDYFGKEQQLIESMVRDIENVDGVRFLIPVHKFDKWLLDWDLALPNANWFAENPDVPLEYYDNIRHILGGSPHSHIQLVDEFEKVESLDGNQIFNCAIKFGKYWQNDFPRWVKHNGTNKEAFEISIKNVNEVFK